MPLRSYTVPVARSRTAGRAVTGGDGLEASAYIHDHDETLTVVLVNASSESRTATIDVPGAAHDVLAYEVCTSRENDYWQSSRVEWAEGLAEVSVPGYGVVTMYGTDFTPTSAARVPRAPERFELLQNYPNPFNPSTTIPFRIAQQGRVRLTVFDLTGRRVGVLIDEQKSPGTYHVDFDDGGLAGGLCLYRPEAGSYTDYKSMIVRR